MEPFDSNQELVRLKSRSKIEAETSFNKEKILCDHCKRTATNGIRCLGMCVADNDY